MRTIMNHNPQSVKIPVNNSFIEGDLQLVPNSKGLVLFAHGSGSSRFSTRNKFVAHELNKAQFSTFLFDLLTPEEDTLDQISREYRFNIPLLADRLNLVSTWTKNNEATAQASLGYFGSSTGAAAALIAAAHNPIVHALVSRGGRPDLAQEYLSRVQCPTLLIVGSEDHDVIALNEYAYTQLHCVKDLVLISGATHLFEEPGTLELVTQNAITWFTKYL